MTGQDRVHVNIPKLNNYLDIYTKRDLTDELTKDQVKDIFLDVYYSGRYFELSQESAFVEIGLKEVMNGDDKTTVESLLGKLCAIREDCH